MIKKIERNYLEINSLNDLIETRLTQNEFSFEKVEPENFQINKFFYKNVGKKHHWIDRLGYVATKEKHDGHTYYEEIVRYGELV